MSSAASSSGPLTFTLLTVYVIKFDPATKLIGFVSVNDCSANEFIVSAE